MTDFESFLSGILVGSVVAALVAIGLWLLWDTDPEPVPVAEAERTVCEVLAVHPATSGGHVVTFECPPGVIK